MTLPDHRSWRRADLPRELAHGAGRLFADAGQEWLGSWHAGPLAPAGQRHGSTALCFAPDGTVVLVTQDGSNWGLPGGRPDGEETWRETLEREVREEACAAIDEAELLGFAQGRCVRGHEQGTVLIRSLWVARVTLHEWRPQHEMLARRLAGLDEARSLVAWGDGILLKYRFAEGAAALARWQSRGE